MIYICVLCGFVYEQNKGLPEPSVDPGKPWDELPADWHCPECGAGKENFDEIPMSSVLLGNRDDTEEEA